MEVEEFELRYEGGALPTAIYLPPGPAPHPGVVIATGGLERGSVDAYRWAAERLATAGYAAFIATYRGPSPYTDAADLKLATDWLASDARIDSARLAIWGHSRGGIGALFSAATDARLRAAISICAPADLLDYLNRLGTYIPAARDSIGQFLGGVPEKYAAVNALNLAGKLLKPILLIHGTADMRVPVDQSLRLAEVLKGAGNENVRLELLPGVGHFMELGTLGYQFDRVMDLAAAWLGEVLG